MRVWVLALLASSVLLFSGCKDRGKEEPPPRVLVMVVSQKTVPVSTEFVGQVAAYLTVELRAKVSGILDHKAFQPGAMVKKGDRLFQIDPRPYEAALDDAKANLADAQADLLKAQQDVERYTPLQAENAIPKQTLDNAVAALAQAKAQVDARRAAVQQAELDLENCTILSPLNGQIGLSDLDEGSLVQVGTTLLATVSQNDPAYVYFAISERDYLFLMDKYLKDKAEGRVDDSRSRGVQLILTDGRLFPTKGMVDFADRAIQPQTGTLTFRALFDNPNGLLMPGMYGRIHAVYEERKDSILVPQKAIQETLGKYFVVVVGEKDVAESRPVKVGPRVGTSWIVEEGLKAGERIVVEGLLKARPGSPVTPELVTEEQLSAQAGS